jgi:hypothetical protein
MCFHWSNQHAVQSACCQKLVEKIAMFESQLDDLLRPQISAVLAGDSDAATLGEVVQNLEVYHAEVRLLCVRKWMECRRRALNKSSRRDCVVAS